MTIVDLFAGIGWGLGLRTIGLREVGIDFDPAVCATRARLGMATIRADLTVYPPARSCTGLIASPPCPDWSSAGKRAGRAGETGWMVDIVPQWAMRSRPRWVACEQVPEALEVWDEHAFVYQRLGYRTWTGILCAADWGVPQTRRRAFLLAHAERQPYPPEPTHSRLGERLFGGRPWVSMAEALGWDGAIATGQRTQVTRAGNVEQYERGTDSPALTLMGTSSNWVLNERQPHGATRQPHEPSMTITASADNGNFRWLNTHRDQREDEGGEPQFERATRVTIPEGLILQGFPPDLPLAGNKSQQWSQIGNAVPPPWAAAIVRGLAA